MILFLARQIPYPPDTGMRIRQFNLLAAYASVGPVQLVFGYESEQELAGLGALEELCAAIHPVPFDWKGKPKRPGPAYWWKDFRDSHTLRPFRSGLFFSREIQRVVEQLAPACRLLHVERLHMVAHLEQVFESRKSDQRLVLDLDDIETDVRREWLRLAPPEAWQASIAERIDLAVLALYQGRALRKFDRVLVASEKDRARLRHRPQIEVIPNGADVQRSLLPDNSDGRTLLCLGTYGYWPNVDGLRAFLQNVLPLIHAEIPDVRVLVVGRDMPEQVSRLHDGVRIVVHANVADIEPYYRRATVSVVPIRLGGGTRIKILEAFTFGRPVVSTAIGCAGLEVCPGQHLLVADQPNDFAQACIALLRNPAQRARLVASARALVEQEYSWDSSRSRLAKLARALLGESPAHANPGKRT